MLFGRLHVSYLDYVFRLRFGVSQSVVRLEYSVDVVVLSFAARVYCVSCRLHTRQLCSPCLIMFMLDSVICLRVFDAVLMFRVACVSRVAFVSCIGMSSAETLTS